MFLLVDSSAVRVCNPLCLNIPYKSIFKLFTTSSSFHIAANERVRPFDTLLISVFFGGEVNFVVNETGIKKSDVSETVSGEVIGIKLAHRRV